MALSSTEMCQNYFYNNSFYQKFLPVPTNISGEIEPILNVSKFIYLWAGFQSLITIYLALFVSEEGVHNVEKDEDEEIDLSFK